MNPSDNVKCGMQTRKRWRISFMQVLVGFMAAGFLLTAVRDGWTFCTLLARGISSSRWSVAAGRVDDSYIHEDVPTGRGYRSRGTTSRTYKPLVRYSFEADGVKHSSENIYFKSGLGSSRRNLALDKAGTYPKGSDVTVYYAPDCPNNCTLERGVRWSYLLGPALSMLVWSAFGTFSVMLLYWLR